MGRNRASKTKSCTDNVGIKAGKVSMEVVGSDATFRRASTDNGTNKSNEPPAENVESAIAKEASQGEISSKKDASHIDERGKDLAFYKNKCTCLTSNIRALERKNEEKTITIRKLEDKIAVFKVGSSKMEDLTYFKNKCSCLTSNIRALEKKIEQKNITIRQKEEENAVLKAKNLQLLTTLAKYEKSLTTAVSEPSVMEIDPYQDDTLDQQKDKEADVQSQFFHNQAQLPTSSQAEEPRMTVDAKQDINWWCDEEPDTSGDIKEFSTPSNIKQMKRSLDAKQACKYSDPPEPNRSCSDKHTGNSIQPSTSSYYGQPNSEKQHPTRKSHSYMQDRAHDIVDRGHPGARCDRQSRQRIEWEPNQNYKIGHDRSTGRLKLDAPAEYKIVKEVDGDLFEAPDDNSLAHCVAEDMRMGSGIAVTFRQKFNCVDELLDQRKRQGDVAVLEDSQHYIYYLVTKRVSTGKPTVDTLERSLKAMRDHVKDHNVSKIAMPRIGCGLDRLEWSRVKPLIEHVFSGLNVTITVYNYREDDSASKGPSYNYVIMKEGLFPVINIEPLTAILCLCAADGSADPVLESLDRKFHILNQYKYANKTLGAVFDIVRPSYLICILFVKKKKDDVLSFTILAQSLVKARKIIDKQKYEYVALEAFHDQHDDLIMEKVITVLRNCFNMKPGKEVWICWPDSDPRK